MPVKHKISPEEKYITNHLLNFYRRHIDSYGFVFTTGIIYELLAKSKRLPEIVFNKVVVAESAPKQKYKFT